MPNFVEEGEEEKEETGRVIVIRIAESIRIFFERCYHLQFKIQLDCFTMLNLQKSLALRYIDS